MKRAFVRVLAAAGVLLAGCTWVPLSPEGEDVQVGSMEEVVDCERVASTSATVKAKVWIIPRSSAKVETELETLARNQSSKLGGDTVAATGEVEDGSQKFAVLNCSED